MQCPAGGSEELGTCTTRSASAGSVLEVTSNAQPFPLLFPIYRMWPFSRRPFFGRTFSQESTINGRVRPCPAVSGRVHRCRSIQPSGAASQEVGSGTTGRIALIQIHGTLGGLPTRCGSLGHGSTRDAPHIYLTRLRLPSHQDSAKPRSICGHLRGRSAPQQKDHLGLYSAG